MHEPRTLLSVILLFVFHSLFPQVNTETLDNIASQLASVGQINVRGQIYADYSNSGGVAAISCQGNYCNIFAHPNAMTSKSVNTWAFIIGHEIGHFALGHNACGKSGKQAEMNADVYGANLAKNAGYSLTNYLTALQSEPNTCSKSHGCWSERINNLKSNFGYSVNYSHSCNNWTSWLVFPWFN